MKTLKINFTTTKGYNKSVWEYFLQNGLTNTITKLEDSPELEDRTSWTGSLGRDVLDIVKSWKSSGMPDFPILEDKTSRSYNKMSIWNGQTIKSQDYTSHGEVTQDRWVVLVGIN